MAITRNTMIIFCSYRALMKFALLSVLMLPVHNLYLQVNLFEMRQWVRLVES